MLFATYTQHTANASPHFVPLWCFAPAHFFSNKKASKWCLAPFLSVNIKRFFLHFTIPWSYVNYKVLTNVSMGWALWRAAGVKTYLAVPRRRLRKNLAKNLKE